MRPHAITCGCRTCASNRDGRCMRGGVVIGQGHGNCTSFSVGKKGSAEFSGELTPHAHILCGCRSCAYNDAMRCLAEKMEVADGLCISRHDLRF